MKVVILAGGGGTRLFPLSRESRPKQFMEIDDDRSLLVHTIERFRNICPMSDILIVTNERYQYLVKSELAACDANDAHVILEPQARNTAPAIALAAAYCIDVLGCSKDEVLFVSTSDHIIRPTNVFAATVEKAVKLAEKDCIVTFGVPPTYPATGFGYIEAGETLGTDGAYRAGDIKEKPDGTTAKRYLEAGNYYWNSGMFVFPIACYFEELARYESKLFACMKDSYEMILQHFQEMPNISIDYAILEKSRRVVLLPLNLYWNDVGSWDAIHEVLDKDVDGNAIKGDCIALDCKNTLIMGNNRLITCVGLENVIVVETQDVILVAQKGKSQRVKDLVGELKKRGRREAVAHMTIYHPWGSYTTIGSGEGYRMKKMVVNPGGVVPCHLHYNRSECWIVASGTAKIYCDGDVKVLRENENVFSPMGSFHGIANPGKIPLEVIEVQNGKYLDEDDIVIDHRVK